VWTGRRWDGPGTTSIESDEPPAFITGLGSDPRLTYALPPTTKRRATVTIRPGQYVVDTKYGTHTVEGFDEMFDLIEG
jgi:hypothetical protein